jgi:hypothetical protein
MTNIHSSAKRRAGQTDAGALALAGIENARFAIASRDAIAAANDLAQAQLYSQRLTNEPSDIIAADVGDGDGSGASDAAGPHASLSPFRAQTEMLAAQADLLDGNLNGADDELRALESEVPPPSIPTDLPLLCARESLDLAVTAASSGGRSDALTQLMDARSALTSYNGHAHETEAKGLAMTIDEIVAQPGSPGALAPYRLGILSAEADRWD